VTVLSTDSYLDGVLVLAHSLRRSGARYPLHVVVTGEVGEPTRRTLARAGIRQIETEPVEVPEEIRVANLGSDFHRHWAGVFDKLTVFSLCQFDKLVFLDSDMLIRANLDELFDKDHMSAVVADISAGQRSRDLNAGLMVIEPQSDLAARLLALLPEVYEDEKRWRAAAGRPPSMGVQALINGYWNDWMSREELHLDPKFNVLTNHLDFYLAQPDRSWRGRDGIHVLHYVGQTKPWMLGRKELARHVGRLVARRRRWEAVAVILYRSALARARRELRTGEAGRPADRQPG
jgi:lipopolysaccharide biosynthesis glycosyltransferase